MWPVVRAKEQWCVNAIGLTQGKRDCEESCTQSTVTSAVETEHKITLGASLSNFNARIILCR